MSTPHFSSPCLYNKNIAKDIWEFKLAKPEGFHFKAGQFVLFDVPLLDNPSDLQPRAFSIASAPHEDELLFVAKMKEGGRASRWISESLSEGEEVGFQGPFGLFQIKEQDQECVLVCTSTGIAPFRSHVLDRFERNLTARMDLIFGARTEDDLFWIEELQKMAQEIDWFFVHLALTAPSEDWTGHKGRVQTLVPLVANDCSSRSIYVCGNPEMTKEVKELCLGEWGVPKGNVHMEGYI